jgi:hypothetical protein
LLSLQVLQNQQIVVLQPWLCGSVDHTANRNIHHEEKARPHFCCSMLLMRSMHWPGYVQGGQEASFGCLLLGVYYRRIPGSTVLLYYKILEQTVYKENSQRVQLFLIFLLLMVRFQTGKTFQLNINNSKEAAITYSNLLQLLCLCENKQKKNIKNNIKYCLHCKGLKQRVQLCLLFLLLTGRFQTGKTFQMKIW